LDEKYAVLRKPYGSKYSAEEIKLFKFLNKERVKTFDERICAIVNKNLQDGEEGIIIAGVKHDAISGLAIDIQVKFISKKELECFWKLLGLGLIEVLREGSGFDPHRPLNFALKT
jgi:hypothetical protein